MKTSKKGIIALLLVLVLGMLIWGAGSITAPRHVDSGVSFNAALWEYRGFDILGQVMLIIAGSFAVVVLLREESRHG
jgi:multisubunit Na+/H+ antiporter MnhB subunit